MKVFSFLVEFLKKQRKNLRDSNIVITPQTLDRDSPSASSSSSPSSSTFSECASNSVHVTTENTNVSVAANNNVKAKKRKQKNVDSLADEELATTLKKVNQTTELLISKELHGESEDDADTFILQKYYSYFKESDTKKQ